MISGDATALQMMQLLGMIAGGVEVTSVEWSEVE
jgi:hypothetical protein